MLKNHIVIPIYDDKDILRIGSKAMKEQLRRQVKIVKKQSKVKNKKSDSESLEERDTASKMSKVDWVDKSKE